VCVTPGCGEAPLSAEGQAARGFVLTARPAILLRSEPAKLQLTADYVRGNPSTASQTANTLETAELLMHHPALSAASSQERRLRC